MNVILLVGLVLGLLGSSLVILSTFSRIGGYVINQDTVEKLERGRQKLSKEGQLFADNPSFELIFEIIGENWDQDLRDGCYRFHRPKLVF